MTTMLSPARLTPAQARERLGAAVGAEALGPTLCSVGLVERSADFGVSVGHSDKPNLSPWMLPIVHTDAPYMAYRGYTRPRCRGQLAERWASKASNQSSCLKDTPHVYTLSSVLRSKRMTTKKMTDPQTGITVTVNNVAYGTLRKARTEEEREDWFWGEVFVEATKADGELIDVDELDIASALSIVELAMTGILGKKASLRR